MRIFIQLLGLYCATVNVLSSSVAFPLYVDGKGDPIYVYYNETDLESSTHMASLCSTFVRQNAKALACSTVSHLEKMASNICVAIAQQNGIEFEAEFDTNDFYHNDDGTITTAEVSQAPDPVVSLANVLSFLK